MKRITLFAATAVLFFVATTTIAFAQERVSSSGEKPAGLVIVGPDRGGAITPATPQNPYEDFGLERQQITADAMSTVFRPGQLSCRVLTASPGNGDRTIVWGQRPDGLIVPLAQLIPQPTELSILRYAGTVVSFSPNAETTLTGVGYESQAAGLWMSPQVKLIFPQGIVQIYFTQVRTNSWGNIILRAYGIVPDESRLGAPGRDSGGIVK